MKGINYLASAVKVYREAIDEYCKQPEAYKVKQEWFEELACITSRGYSSGFYFDDPDQVSPDYAKQNVSNEHRFVGKILHSIDQNHAKVEVRNKIFKGDTVDVLSRKGPSKRDKINNILNYDGTVLSFAQPSSKVVVEFNNNYLPNDLIRSVKIA